ncbi:MAG: 30S ribosomal protein S12 methylthiotransferase RimO [Atopobiaceae bacterium]|uniref:30S ribosomal protein S12 methylthiotransferase RimO n=1 Tax=Paratractidigestivibacter sp. TaxID=2847316 RepID=UPI000D79E490|nr:30S ribosomal protein S12 methylthiotransferase RimO [Atopobiaceae bacterium]PWM32284.1 MAG: 30S ribosomal protein S12 methylthiotransferase RimO [Coriobacteriia bacterium]
MDSPLGKILFITLGCAKNEVDTDRMRALLLAAGFAEADGVDDADAAIVNTCSFLASATEESVEATLELAEGRAEGVRSCPIIMCGCVPSRYGDDLPEQLPEVAAFVKADDEDGIVGVVADVLGISVAAPVLDAGAMLRTVQGASAFVKISEGCDRFCAFCAIPYIRGRYHSRPADEIVAEVSALMEQGVREVILIGQDTGIWGSDFEGDQTLAKLLVRVAEAVRPYSGWVRVLYLQPEGMTDELIAAIRDTPEVLPYIDIPIQHCSERVLKAMGRSGDPEQLHALFARLRDEIPGMVLRTTGMAGFPGETDEEADELYDFIEAEEFDYTSVFAYSQEEGTRAAAMPDQVDEDVKLERTQRLIDLVEELGFSATAKHVGERVKVIIDGVEETDDGVELIGHTWFQAPDCDGAVHIQSGEAAVGDIVTVDLVDSFCYEMVGTIVEEA